MVDLIDIGEVSDRIKELQRRKLEQLSELEARLARAQTAPAQDSLLNLQNEISEIYEWLESHLV